VAADASEEGVIMETIWLEVVLIAVAIVANGFFAGSEIALVSSRISRLAQLRHEHVHGATAALRLKETPEGLLATIQIAITAVGTLAAAVGGATAVEALTPALAGLGVPTQWAEGVALGIVIVAITYFSLVVGELMPKAVALRNPERIACLVAPIKDLLRAAATGRALQLPALLRRAFFVPESLRISQLCGSCSMGDSVSPWWSTSTGASWVW
jgi:putative hemolysin